MVVDNILTIALFFFYICYWIHSSSLDKALLLPLKKTFFSEKKEKNHIYDIKEDIKEDKKTTVA